MGRVVCVVGPSCAGKTTFCEFLTGKISCRLYGASSIPRKRYDESKCGIPLMHFVINEFMKKGMSTFSFELIDRIKREEQYKCPVIIIDGFRACEEVDLFKDEFGKAEVFGIYADSRTRYERHTRRPRGQTLTYEQFVEKDMIEYNFGIARMLREYAKEIVINEDTLESLEKKATALAKTLQGP